VVCTWFLQIINNANYNTCVYIQMGRIYITCVYTPMMSSLRKIQNIYIFPKMIFILSETTLPPFGAPSETQASKLLNLTLCCQSFQLLKMLAFRTRRLEFYVHLNFLNLYNKLRHLQQSKPLILFVCVYIYIYIPCTCTNSMCADDTIYPSK